MCVGVAVIFVIVPMQYVFGYLIIFYKKKNNPHSRDRNIIVKEILPAMKLVKFYAWESYFEKLIGEVLPWLSLHPTPCLVGGSLGTRFKPVFVCPWSCRAPAMIVAPPPPGKGVVLALISPVYITRCPAPHRCWPAFSSYP